MSRPRGMSSYSQPEFDRFLDRQMDKVASQRDQLLEDSPTRSEMNQFGDFTQGYVEQSPSLERGMAHNGPDLSVRSRFGTMPPLSSLSSVSSGSSSSGRKARSDSGRDSFYRMSPMNARKVTNVGRHDSETHRTPAPVAARRIVSPREFKDTNELFHDLGLDPKKDRSRVAPGGNKDNAAGGQSFRVPSGLADLTQLFASAKKSKQASLHRAIESVPLSRDNQELFVALQELQLSVEALESRNGVQEAQLSALKETLRRANDQLKTERERAAFAEAELKQAIAAGNTTTVGAAGAAAGNTDARVKALEQQTQRLQATINTLEEAAKESRLQLQLAQEELKAVEEERDEAVKRLAEAFANIDLLTAERDTLRQEVLSLKGKIVDVANTSAQPSQQQQQPAANTAAARIAARLKKHEAAPILAAAQAPPAASPTATEFEDEAIEMSRSSLLDDSEVEEIAREIEERRAKKAADKERAALAAAAKAKAAQLRAKKVEKAKLAAKTKAHSRPVRKLDVVSEESDDDALSYAESSEEEYESASIDEYESDELADDEPSRILHRRMPAQHRRSTKQQHQHQQRAAAAERVDVQRMIKELGRHDTARCTICCKRRRDTVHGDRRPSAYATDAAPAAASGEYQPRTGDTTFRPSQEPLSALRSVLAGLEDEYRHLQLGYRHVAERLRRCDPAVGRRERKDLAAQVRDAVAKLENKADQIYAIVDAIEATQEGAAQLDDRRWQGAQSAGIDAQNFQPQAQAPQKEYAYGYAAGPGSRPPTATATVAGGFRQTSAEARPWLDV